MAKKGGKILGILALGAAAAGTYLYLQKKNSEIPENMEDDEDLDNFDESEETTEDKRSYTSLNFSTVEQKVKDTATKFAGSAEKAYATVEEKLQGAAEKIEEFFDDRKTAHLEEDAEEKIEEELEEEELGEEPASEEAEKPSGIPIE